MSRSIRITNRTMTIKYSFIHGFYWPALCSIYSYASVYLSDKDFSAAQIGVLLAVANVLALLLQPVAASFFDKSRLITIKQGVMLFILTAMLLAVVLTALPLSVEPISIIYTILLMIMMTAQPLLNSLCFFFADHGIKINFGLARGIGSIAYAVLSALLGKLIEVLGADCVPHVYLILMTLLLISVAIYRISKLNRNNQNEAAFRNDGSSVNPEIDKLNNTTHKKSEPLSLLRMVCRYKRFMLLLIGIVLVFNFHFMFNNYTLMVVQSLGGASGSMGICLFVSAGIELPAMACFTFILKKFRLNSVMRFSAVFFAVKAVLTYLAPNLTILYLIQLLQMFGYALYQPASVLYAASVIDDSNQVKGQAFMTSAVTCGGIIGSLLGGWLIDQHNVSTMLLVGGCTSILGMLIIQLGIDNKPFSKVKEMH